MLSKSFIVAGLMAALTGPASATPFLFASIDLTTFRQSVEDIDPNDGIAASFSQRLNGRDVQACVALPLPPYCPRNDPVGGHVQSFDPAETIHTEADVPGLNAEATAGPALIQSVLDGERASGPLGARASQNFALTFSGAGRYTAQVDYQLIGLDYGNEFPVGSALVGLLMPSVGARDVEQLYSFTGMEDRALTGTLTVVYDVTDGEQQALLTYAWAESVGRNGPVIGSPVPEPHTWALALAGLGLVAVNVRRRRLP